MGIAIRGNGNEDLTRPDIDPGRIRFQQWPVVKRLAATSPLRAIWGSPRRLTRHACSSQRRAAAKSRNSKVLF
jgi:hypothetical protein